MNIFEIKEEYKAVVVGYNNCGLPLGERNDLHLLAEMGKHNPGLRKYFVAYPSPEAIAAHKEERFLATHPVETSVIDTIPEVVIAPDPSTENEALTELPEEQ